MHLPRYGIDRPPFLSSLVFKVGKSKDNRDVLLVTSTDAIPEPFVTFLVEVNWARGRLMREYTVLLDPPVYTPGENASTSAPVTAPTTAASPPASTASKPASGASASHRLLASERRAALEESACAGCAAGRHRTSARAGRPPRDRGVAPCRGAAASGTISQGRYAHEDRAQPARRYRPRTSIKP